MASLSNMERHERARGSVANHSLPGAERHIPPHEWKRTWQLEFDDVDWDILKRVFGDEDTALAAEEILYAAPPEMQVVAVQFMNLIRR